MPRQVEVLIIGGGPGGYVSAIRFSQLGRKVALVEMDALGGTCTNRGCIPSKTLLHVGRVLDDLKRAGRMGITSKGVSVDFQKVQAWNRSTVERVRRGIEYLCESNGIEVMKGRAAFDSPNSVVVHPQGETVEAEIIVVATGSVPSDLPVLRMDSKTVLSSDDIFRLGELPAEMVIVGGGAIGVEMATAFASLGAKVTIVEIMDQILPGFDGDLIAPVSSSLQKLGVDIRLKARIVNAAIDDGGAVLSLEGGGELRADRVLVAVGRRPNTDGLNLASMGIDLDQRGFIKVNDRLETTARGIFAVGDVTGLPFLAHRAMEQGYYAAGIACGVRDTYPYPAMPSVVYTDPEIATVGLGEAEAVRRGYKVVTGNFPFAASGRAKTMGRLEGFVKLVGDASGGALLGAQMVGPGVSELIGECSTLVTGSISLEEIAAGVHPHPTLSEALSEAAKAALGRPVHFKES